MYPLEYAAIVVYLIVVVRSFSFGVYGLKNGNGALFAVTLAALAVSAALFFEYLMAAL